MCRTELLEAAPEFQWNPALDKSIQARMLASFCRSVALHTRAANDGIYAITRDGGAAVWMSPDCRLTFEQLIRNVVPEEPVNLEWMAFRRGVAPGNCLEEIRRQIVPGPHWYLAALGFESPEERNTAGRALIEPFLSRADADGLPCYLETFDESALPVYSRFGFRVMGAGQIRRDGPDFWVMARRPISAILRGELRND